MENCDAAIIMIDLADQASIKNAVSWYSKFFQFFLSSDLFSQLMSDYIEEIMSSRQHFQHSASLPVVIYSWKAYEKTDKRAMDPTKISWSDWLGDTPFFHTTHLDLSEKSNRIIASQSNRKPFAWILEQMTGQVDVVCFLNLFTPHYCPFVATCIYLFFSGIFHRLLPKLHLKHSRWFSTTTTARTCD